MEAIRILLDIAAGSLEDALAMLPFLPLCA